MAKLTDIFTGMAKGPEAINDNFSDLDKGGAISDSGWTSCGTLINGATLYNNNPIKRRVLDFGKFKLVQIRGTLAYKASDIPSNTNVVILPAGYPPSESDTVAKIMPASNNSVIRWHLNAGGIEIMLVDDRLDDNIDAGNKLWLPIAFDYISQSQ